MNTDQLLDLYDRVAEAPDAISRLRRFVLDLAVRGKLVAQDPTDEPVSRLLRLIATGRARLVKAGEIRKPRDLGNGQEADPLFDLPATWRWCRLDTVGAIIGGGTPPAGDPENFAEPGDGVPWLTPADLGGYRDLYVTGGARDLTKKGLTVSSATIMPAGTVLFTSRAPIGYVAIASNPISTNQGFKSIVPYIAEISRFIALVMQTFAPDIDAKAPGTTFKEVSGKIVASVPFPLPPLAEQHRIVAKVDQLMALLDRLEGERNRREAVRDRLTTASLTRLTAPDTDADEFPTHARFALDALPALTTRPDQIKQLRQTILNLAVRGKLVPQDPADEPASELLKRIEDAKATAKRDTGDARIKLAPTPDSNALPMTLPIGWSAQSFENLFLFIDYRGNTPPKTTNGISLITAKNVRMGSVNREPREFIAESTFKTWMTRGFPKLGDLFFTTEAPLANICINDITEPFALAQRVICFQPFAEVNTRYLMFAIMSDVMQNLIQQHSTGLTAKGIKAAKLKPLPLPIPPVAEQHRIVAKVDALMALCDRLEAALGTADTTRARLLESLLHEALTPVAAPEVAAAE